VVDGMDCSGFTRAVYNLCGINIPRTSREQFKAGNPVEKTACATAIWFSSALRNLQ